MKYVSNNLQKDETIKTNAEISKLSAIPWLFFFAIFVFWGVIMLIALNSVLYLIIFSICGIVPFFVALLDIKNQELVVTNKRVLGKRGILGVKTIDILLDKIESVTVNAGFIGRIIGYYTIRISGSGTTKLAFIGIKNAEEIKNMIASIS